MSFEISHSSDTYSGWQESAISITVKYEELDDEEHIRLVADVRDTTEKFLAYRKK